MKNTDFKELAKYYEVQIEGWHLFYDSFKDYDNALLVGNGILVEMNSELIKAKVNNPNNERIKATEKRIQILFDVLSKMVGLNSKCNNLQIQLKKSVANQLETEKENQRLIAEINSLKTTFDETA